MFRVLALLALLALALTGCSRKEPRITGRKSDPPANLQCAWKPGMVYHLRFDLEQLTDPDANESSDTSMYQHRVTFAQECLVRVTNAPGNRLMLDLEVKAIEMERAKGPFVVLVYDSEHGGERTDDFGYAPVLDRLIGGHLRCQVSPDGRMMRVDGLNEWLDRALGVEVSTNAGPGPGARRVARAAPTAGRGSSVNSTVRSFFSPDLFRQLIEFQFLSGNPVHVSDTWTTQGDTPMGTRLRVNFDAAGTFKGWQMHAGTNCARVNFEGTLGRPRKNPGGTNNVAPPAGDHGTLGGMLWIDPNLGFPVETVLHKEMKLGASTSMRTQGTNTVTVNSAPKSVHQSLSIKLLEVTASDGTPTQ